MSRRKSNKKPTRQHSKKPQAAKKGGSPHAGPSDPFYTPQEAALLQTLSQWEQEDISSRALMRAAKVTNKNTFYRLLRQLERKGAIAVNEKHRVRYLPPDKGLPAQIVSLSPGFAFAKPETGEDIFIHGSALKGAFLGDQVLLTDIKTESRGKRGRIQRITARSKAQLTGTVRIADGTAHIQPDNALRYPFAVHTKDLKGAADGDKVAFRPKQDNRGDWNRAVVQHVFGAGESARVCADAIISRLGIPSLFSDAVLQEARHCAQEARSDADITNRLDLRKETVFTIDGADAKDLDDAISVRKIKGGYRLGVHIADVSHYVKSGTALDREAIARGTSVYFADRVIPMLPEALSNDACSLNPGTDKLTFSALITFDMQGEMKKYDFQKTVISSKVRGVYSEINQLFDGSASPALRKKYKPVATALGHARQLAKILQTRSANRGEMELTSDELRFVLDEDGRCVALLPRQTGEAESLIEQMMIAANRAAAKFARQHQLPFLYRVHEKPQPDRIADLCDLLDKLGISCKEIRTGTPSAGDFGQILKRVKNTPREALVSQRVLRTMEKARYAPEELGHFGLALMDYSHFTSPIRRYPDLAIHRILTDFLAGISPKKISQRYDAFTKEIAKSASDCEVRAVTGERDAEDCYIAEYMKQHLGETHTGVISGATTKGIFVRIPNGAEGFVSLADFTDCDYQYDGSIAFRDRRSGSTLMVGDSIDIIVAASDIASGRVDFMPRVE